MSDQNNHPEFEVKVLDFDKEKLVQKLKELGAKETEDVLMRRWVFDMKSEDAEWIRLRTDGKKTFLTYKHKYHGVTEVGKTQEIEVEVADFDQTALIFHQMKVFTRIFYQENRRHLFVLDDFEVCFDTWPMLPTFMEVESTSKQAVFDALKTLDLEGKDVGDLDVMELYKERGIDIHSFKELKF